MMRAAITTPTFDQLNIFLFDGYSYTCQRRWNACCAPAETVTPVRRGLAGSLPLENAVRVVDEGLALGMRSVRLTGISSRGDPFAYPDLEALLNHLETRKVDLMIDTSGAGLTPALAARLSNNPGCSVRIALAGADAATHDAISGHAGNFEQTVSAARMLADEGIAPEILFPIVRRSAGQVSAAVRLAEQLGAGSLQFIAVSPFSLHAPNGNKNGGAHAWNEPLTVEELIALGRKVERYHQRQTRLKLTYDQPPAFRGLHPHTRLDGQSNCQVHNSLSLLPDGSYTLCGTALYSSTCLEDNDRRAIMLGNSTTDRLEAIWRQHPTLAALRAGASEDTSGICINCLVKSACLGRCPIENLQRTGSFWGPYWFCEAAVRAGLFPAGRLVESGW